MKKSAAIGTLSELIEALDPEVKNVEEYNQAISSLQLDYQAIEEYCHWKESFYTRNLVAKTPAYELLLLCWEPGQCSPIHNHQGQDCWMSVLQGDLREVLFHPERDGGGRITLREGKITHLPEGNWGYINDEIALHQLQNKDEKKRAITLHLYSYPIETCNIFCPETGKVTPKKLSYHSIEGKVSTPDLKR